MQRVNIATLKAGLSYYLRAAQKGETIRILDRNREVATLSGVLVSPEIRFSQKLVEQGRAEWQGGKPLIKPLKLRKGPASLAEAVLEDRE